jgi:hypothetical protein
VEEIGKELQENVARNETVKKLRNDGNEMNISKLINKQKA